VAEQLHRYPWLDALGQQQAGASMAQVVEALAWQACQAKEALKALGDGGVAERLAVCRCEH